jgi:hypothetical protein
VSPPPLLLPITTSASRNHQSCPEFTWNSPQHFGIHSHTQLNRSVCLVCYYYYVPHHYRTCTP